MTFLAQPRAQPRAFSKGFPDGGNTLNIQQLASTALMHAHSNKCVNPQYLSKFSCAKQPDLLFEHLFRCISKYRGEFFIHLHVHARTHTQYTRTTHRRVHIRAHAYTRTHTQFTHNACERRLIRQRTSVCVLVLQTSRPSIKRRLFIYLDSHQARDCRTLVCPLQHTELPNPCGKK